MSKPFNGVINIDIQDSTPDWTPYAQPNPPEGAPNVMYVVLDDVGFSALEPYGGMIEVPHIKRIADRGLRYTNFHTTALCSPTRSCLLTGRNHTTNGMACISEASSGFPNANGHIPLETAMAPEVLGELGWSTFMVGKWHLCAEDEENLASRRRGWPSGRGFDRWYGFLGAETNQWYPDLVEDNHMVDPPQTPEEGYHLSVDITDKAMSFIRDMKAVAPEKPWFLYYAFGAGHAPHHAPKEWADKYKGKFDMGYEAYREIVFKNQKAMGIISNETELSPINPYTDLKGPEGQDWPALDVVRPWDSLKDDEKKLFRRMAEVYAGFVSHADHQLGRMLDYLEESGQLDNTLIIIVSDNGASGEGGPNGSVNENKFMNGIPDTIEDNIKYLDVLGSPLTYNHYPTGWAWAFNTPFKMWKRYANYQGGTADPMIVSWPDKIKKPGIRTQYQHAIDIVPTIYDCLGVTMPDVVKGATQIPLEGASFKATFDDVKAPGRLTQFYSMLSTRAIYHDGWKASSVTPATPDAWGEFPTQRWELFHTDVDPSECHDLAEKEPAKLAELTSLWWAQAGMYNALPLETRTAVAILNTERPQLAKPRDQYVYYPGCAEVPEAVAVNVRNRSYSITAEVTLDKDGKAGGVLFAHGCRFGGHALYIKDGKLKYDYNYVGMEDQYVESSKPIPTGAAVRLSASFVKDDSTDMPTTGTLTLYINDEAVGDAKIKTQPGKFSLAGEGLNVGLDRGEPVTADYPGEAPWPLTGGTLTKVVVNVSGDPWIDREKEVQGAFMRD
ncbi:MAG TPA: arylsulfatase [Actinomycetes bacterium]|nr:arylsulfatase [Actinomycetes bacterium]